ncbi:MAG: histidine kinase [Proteobacteria bacterium]|nr:histidine kinase [Pseudomonadota bacterium]
MEAKHQTSIRILIVEDETEKLGKIMDVIGSTKDSHLIRCSEVRDAMGARRLLEREQYDLLIVDLRIPNRIGEPAEAAQGAELLREVCARDKYHRPYHIIGITAYSESYESSFELFSDQVWAILRYDIKEDGWARQLRNKLSYLLSSKQLLRFSDGKTYETDLAIITALDSELAAVRRLPADWQEHKVPHDSTRYFTGVFSSASRNISVVAAAAPRMGMAMSAVLASKLITNFRPRYLCMCGIAAGVKGRTNLGDILAVDPSWDWGSGKRLVDKDGKACFSPAPNQLPLEPRIRDRLKAYVDRTSVLHDIQKAWPGAEVGHALRLHVGPVASGAAVLADPNVVGSVKDQQRQLIGIEMEVYGVLTATENCGEPRPIGFALKSVCDFGDAEKSDDFQPYAAYTSAQFLYKFSLEELDCSGI